MNLHYAIPELDRHSHLRLDSDWLKSKMADNDSYFVPIWQGKTFFYPYESQASNLHYILASDLSTALKARSHPIFLGRYAARYYFALDLSHLSEVEVLASLPEGIFLDLREFGPVMPSDYGGLGAYARAMTYWHRHHQYCGQCGSETVSKDAGHRRVCCFKECQRSHFPRLDPVVIMLVTQFDALTGQHKCLLGRSPQFPEGVQSTLAGFVEPGETLEDAVRREVYEEAGIKIGDVQYQASQPWPFPASLMLGFQAEALTTNIYLDQTELVEADWFSPQQVAEAVNWMDEGRLKLPRQDSIAYHLIKSWLATYL